MEEIKKIKLAVLIGGGGRLEAIYKGTQQPQSRAEIALVVSFKRQSSGMEWATKQGLNAQYLRWADFKQAGRSRAEYDAALAQLLQAHRIELVVLAGWGLLLTPAFLDRFAGRIINVHPALLTATAQAKFRLANGHFVPVFRGNDALEKALHSGVNTTGCTVHYVTRQMDTGPLIMPLKLWRLAFIGPKTKFYRPPLKLPANICLKPILVCNKNNKRLWP